MIFVLLIISLIFVGIDIYAYQTIRFRVKKWTLKNRKRVLFTYFGTTVLITVGVWTYFLSNRIDYPIILRVIVFGTHFTLLFAKMSIITFQLIDDGRRLVVKISQRFSSKKDENISDKTTTISRSEFLTKVGLGAGSVALANTTFGIISGAYDYRLRKRTVYIPSLPKAFDGIKVAQLSDIHSGSFFNKVAVKGGVEMLLAEKPDIVFFTGDLVNDRAEEVKNYIDIFNKVKAPLGVHSILGNHDYGEYYYKKGDPAKAKNLLNVKKAHEELGWQLMCNENKLIRVDNEVVSLVGVENWGTGNFPKYGDLNKALVGVEDIPTKILLSHDPSHWDAVVRKEHQDIELMLSGHTHGMQLGVEIGDFRWSPVGWKYKQWADLYQEKNQQIYVNRGYGFIGFPGRIGILPEVTILELKKG